jgi:hypothetical protein
MNVATRRGLIGTIIVRFITKGDDMCEELNIDSPRPGKLDHANGTTQSGPVAEGAASAA